MLQECINPKSVLKFILSVPYVKRMQIRRHGPNQGLGYAILYAYFLFDKEPVTVILPEVMIDQYESNLQINNLAAMLKYFKKTGCSQMLVYSIEDITNYGIVDG